jgi:endonuclease/exonuclease/phosphatase family metal-dependent hydrolase
MRLRVVSWNVHGCVGTDRVFDPERTAATLRRLQPDIALLQEVGDNRGVHPPIDQANFLAHALGLFCAVGITLRASVHGYGSCTLTRWPVLDSESVDLSFAGREPRLCLRVVIGPDDVRLTTLNVHLGLGADERRFQLSQLLPTIDGRGLEPLIMGGDFNDFPPGPVTFTLHNRLTDVARLTRRRRTFPSRLPLLRLDRVYASPDLRIAGVYVDRAADSRVASDHLPVVCDFEILERERPLDADPP